MLKRCDWSFPDEMMMNYHDTEWGVPLFDDVKLFEFIVLDAFQAGLSWSIILKKRSQMRVAFDNFQPEIIASYNDEKFQELLINPEIIRNKLKIGAAIKNAQAYLNILNTYNSFSEFIWQFTDGKTIIHKCKTLKEVPTSSAESDKMSRELKLRGFSFVGTTICYAFMQAAGMVNDHTTDCFRYEEINLLAKK